MEIYFTPMKTPTARTRRKALSPCTQVPDTSTSFNSPYHVVELRMNEDELKAHVLDQDKIIREIKSDLKKMEEAVNSKMNESVLIETSNRLNAHESLILRKDIASLERKVGELKEKLRLVESDKQAEIVKRASAEDNLRRRIIEKEELEQQLTTAKDSIDQLQGKSLQDVDEVRIRNQALCIENSTLKVWLAECKAEKFGDMQRRIGELSAANKILQGKVMEHEEKESILAKQLAEAQDNVETANSEVTELQKTLAMKEGSASLTHNYLLEELNKTKEQKAALRCELIELRRNYDKQAENLKKLESSAMLEETVSQLQSELASSRKQREHLESEGNRMKKDLQAAQEKVKKLEEALNEALQQVGELNVEREFNRELREELKKAETNLSELKNTLEIVDTQCEQYRKVMKRAEVVRQKALDDCAELTVKLREAERELERQRVSEAETINLRAEKERLEMKIRYLNDEIRETHNDYREELAQLSRQISESKNKEVMDNEAYVLKIDELKAQLSQLDNASRSAKRRVDELTMDNEKLQEQISTCVARELEVTAENKKLRSGLAEAVSKIEHYKNDAERSKKISEEMAEQLGETEERINTLDEQVINLEEKLREKEKLEAYLQSQIKVKDMPKVSRRSTLLRTPSDSSLEIVDPVVVENLENEKSSLLKELEAKKKELMSKRVLPPPVLRDHKVNPISTYCDTSARHPMAGLQSNSIADMQYTHKFKKPSSSAASTPQKAIMRHDIPHRWNELRHFGLFSIKCAVCFVGVPTLAKKKRCAHCGIIVHSQCARRVVNTCGLPDQCANYYLDTHTTPNGRMNGWVRIFRDDSNTREWQSAWGEMDEKRLAFYDNDSIQTDLRKPFLSVDLQKELRIVRVGTEVPLKADISHVSHNIVHVKAESRNIYILAPSVPTARRWAEALQNASTKKMMLTRRPSSFSEQSCILVLSSPNNLTIHATCVIDDYLLIGAQSGLFFTHISSARVPARIGGFDSVTVAYRIASAVNRFAFPRLTQCLGAVCRETPLELKKRQLCDCRRNSIECLWDLNILALVINDRRSLAILPLPALKLALNSLQPSIRADVLSGYDYLHALVYHHQDGQRYLCAASSAKVHVLKYNAARDVFTGHQMIETMEPAMCMLSTTNGFLYGSDSLYIVQTLKGALEPERIVDSNTADYPVALFQIRDDEVLLAYQNYGVFVNSKGHRTRNELVEWEHMPMEFAYTAPYLYVVHYESIEILQVAEYTGPESSTILDEREVFTCQNAHVVCCRPNGDVYISISNTDSVELHRFNATNSKRSTTKRKGLSSLTFDKRSKVA